MPFLRFHLHAGARLALRAAAPAIGVPVVGLLLQQDPAGAAAGLARWIAAPAGGLASGMALACVAVGLAAWGAPRVTSGSTGWLRHLPATETVRRRAALTALFVVQAPLLVAWLAAAMVTRQQGDHPAAQRLLAVLLTMAAASVAVWPGARRWRSLPLAAAALATAAVPWRWAIPSGLLFLVAATRLAGPLASAGRSQLTRAPFGRTAAGPIPVPLRIGVRALGSTALVAALGSLLPLAAAAAFRANNTGLPPDAAAGAARLGGGLTVAFLLATLVDRLVTRRPAWLWARSLPTPAAQRIDQDALLLGAPCLVALAVTARMDAASGLAVAGCLPALALRAAGALRRKTDTKMGPAGPMLAESALVAGAVALVPWVALALLGAVPLARRAAAEEDRRQKVSLWEERHHAEAGDPLSWSGR